jgi:hypothetical protein
MSTQFPLSEAGCLPTHYQKRLVQDLVPYCTQESWDASQQAGQAGGAGHYTHCSPKPRMINDNKRSNFFASIELFDHDGNRNRR